MCWLPQTIRIQQGYSQAFTNHDCRRPQEMGPWLTHPAVPSHNNGLLQGRSCKLSCHEKWPIFLKSHILIRMWRLVCYKWKLKVTESRKSELNYLCFQQGGGSALGFSFGSKGNSSKAAGLGSPRKAAALVPQCLGTISMHLCRALIGSIG